jgi:hypothetical protein
MINQFQHSVPVNIRRSFYREMDAHELMRAATHENVTNITVQSLTHSTTDQNYNLLTIYYQDGSSIKQIAHNDTVNACERFFRVLLENALMLLMESELIKDRQTVDWKHEGF